MKTQPLNTINGEIRISVEIEPVVKLVCVNIDCLFNLANFIHDSQTHCNLKNIRIGHYGNCMEFEKLVIPEKPTEEQ